MEKSYTNTALQAIAKALNDGIQQRSAMIIIISAIVLIIIILAVIIRIRNRKKTRTAAEASYQKLIRKFNLTILELDLIDDLSKTLKKPEDKYNLLLSKSRFRQAEHKLQNISEKQQSLIEGLKIKLGFTESEEDEGITSTSLLKNGMPVKISYRGENNINAEIYSTAETNITIKCPNQKIPITHDDAVSLYVNLNGCLRQFKLHPDKIKGDLFSAQHEQASSEEKIKLNIESVIEIETPDSETRELTAKIVLLTKQGAFIQDKKNILQAGDPIRFFLSNDHKKSFPAYAEVLQISEEKQLASIKFIEK